MARKNSSFILRKSLWKLIPSQQTYSSNSNTGKKIPIEKSLKCELLSENLCIISFISYSWERREDFHRHIYLGNILLVMVLKNSLHFINSPQRKACSPIKIVICWWTYITIGISLYVVLCHLITSSFFKLRKKNVNTSILSFCVESKLLSSISDLVKMRISST